MKFPRRTVSAKRPRLYLDRPYVAWIRKGCTFDDATADPFDPPLFPGSGRQHITDLQRLCDLALFNANYLHLDHEGHQLDANE